MRSRLRPILTGNADFELSWTVQARTGNEPALMLSITPWL